MEIEDMTTIDNKNQFHKYDQILRDMGKEIQELKEKNQKLDKKISDHIYLQDIHYFGG